MCVINWFKSLFKKEEKKTERVTVNTITETPKSETIAEPQPVKKNKKRGRPRKKKKVEQTTNPQQA